MYIEYPAAYTFHECLCFLLCLRLVSCDLNLAGPILFCWGISLNLDLFCPRHSKGIEKKQKEHCSPQEWSNATHDGENQCPSVFLQISNGPSRRSFWEVEIPVIYNMYIYIFIFFQQKLGLTMS